MRRGLRLPTQRNTVGKSKDERAVLLPIRRGQRRIVVHGGGCTGFVLGALLVWKAIFQVLVTTITR